MKNILINLGLVIVLVIATIGVLNAQQNSIIIYDTTIINTKNGNAIEHRESGLLIKLEKVQYVRDGITYDNITFEIDEESSLDISKNAIVAVYDMSSQEGRYIGKEVLANIITTYKADTFLKSFIEEKNNSKPARITKWNLETFKKCYDHLSNIKTDDKMQEMLNKIAEINNQIPNIRYLEIDLTRYAITASYTE